MLSYLQPGELKTYGYAGGLIEYTLRSQLLDEKTWKLFVNQFRLKSDDSDGGWRGEFWGKMMRGGALTYRATKNRALYGILKNSVLDMMSAAEKDGRISTYSEEKELFGWDLWGRKYVLLGMLYFYEIAESKVLKKRIVRNCMRQADCIIGKVGKGKKNIFDTSSFWGALNSCSLLDPFVKLYRLTDEKRYFDFCEYIVETGFDKDVNLIELCLGKEKYPYEFPNPKAYETISCFEGLAEFYRVTGREQYLTAVKNFVDMLEKTDYTIIGCCGCKNELFDHSSLKQTEPSADVMQETCVSVTLAMLCERLLEITGDEKYAAMLEKTTYNAIFGAVNNREQTMVRCVARTWVNSNPISVPHESYPFDSYSPLFRNRRARLVGGFKELQNGRTYGCCACIGSAGTAIAALGAVMKQNGGLTVNLYQSARVETQIDGKTIHLRMHANLYGRPYVSLLVSGGEFALRLRMPQWAKNFRVEIGGQLVTESPVNGYLTLKRQWNGDKIELFFKMPVTAHMLNGKTAFTRGPVVLARDSRFEDFSAPLSEAFSDGQELSSRVCKIVKNTHFESNLTVKLTLKQGTVMLCDYSEAGKNYDDEQCDISVWQECGVCR